MTDLEIELLAMEFNDAWAEVEARYSTSPDWWLIGSGRVKASPEVYNKAKQIFKEFMQFKATPFCETFDHTVEEFTAAKLQNRI